MKLISDLRDEIEELKIKMEEVLYSFYGMLCIYYPATLRADFQYCVFSTNVHVKKRSTGNQT